MSAALILFHFPLGKAMLTVNRRATSSTPKFQRGEIYLEDDDEALYIVEKPITLQSPPLPESKLPTSQETPATQPAVEDFAGNNASGKV